MKRANGTAVDGTNKKKGKVDETVSENTVLEEGRIYLTKIDVLPPSCNADTFSLKELLAAIVPRKSLLFNYMIDMDWVMRQYPKQAVGRPITFVAGEKMGTDARSLQREAKHYGNAVTVLSARLPLPFGTHHTKLMLFEDFNHRIHIVVSTANLIEGDWALKTQAFYYCSANIGETAPEEPSPLALDLISYLSEYRLAELEPWMEWLKRADLSHVKDRLVTSVPGYHTDARMTKFGHLRLRALVAGLVPPSASRHFSFVAQCSSIGSLGAKADQWLTSHFLCSLRGGHSAGEPSSFALVFPTVDQVFLSLSMQCLQVRESLEGYEAGGSIPYSESTHQKQLYLKDFMYKWKSEDVGRSRAMPHVKSYAAVDNDTCKPRWCLLTSANLSKAAWGEVQKKGKQIMIRSFELGVLIANPDRSRLPFDVPLHKYEKKDVPWTVDTSYSTPDVYGRTWP